MLSGCFVQTFARFVAACSRSLSFAACISVAVIIIVAQIANSTTPISMLFCGVSSVDPIFFSSAGCNVSLSGYPIDCVDLPPCISDHWVNEGKQVLALLPSSLGRRGECPRSYSISPVLSTPTVINALKCREFLSGNAEGDFSPHGVVLLACGVRLKRARASFLSPQIGSLPVPFAVGGLLPNRAPSCL